jgi:hypothetical protein
MRSVYLGQSAIDNKISDLNWQGQLVCCLEHHSIAHGSAIGCV